MAERSVSGELEEQVGGGGGWRQNLEDKLSHEFAQLSEGLRTPAKKGAPPGHVRNFSNSTAVESVSPAQLLGADKAALYHHRRSRSDGADAFPPSHPPISPIRPRQMPIHSEENVPDEMVVFQSREEVRGHAYAAHLQAQGQSLPPPPVQPPPVNPATVATALPVATEVRELPAFYNGAVGYGASPSCSTSASSDAGEEEWNMRLRKACGGRLISHSDLSRRNRIGKGSFGEVYQALYGGNVVAVKTLNLLHEHSEGSSSVGAAREEFLGELSTMMSLAHPCIVRCFGVTESPPCIVMEYIQRGSVFDIIHKQNIPLPWPLRVRMLLQAAHGMKYLHKHSIVHRDLKSMNLLVDQNWGVKIADFGLSRAKTSASHVSTQHKMAGKVKRRQ